MDGKTKKIVLNPVLGAPWKTQMYKVEENPSFYFTSGNKGKNKQVSFKKRQELANIDLLRNRFPGLKKCEAKAALTIAQKNLEKAIILLEVSNCYRREVTEKHTDVAYLKNIHINLRYDKEKQDPTIRNVVFESSFGMKSCQKTNFGPAIEESHNQKQKVGVLIVKTNTGYKAVPFNDVC